jgi:general secretion pathway protein E
MSESVTLTDRVLDTLVTAGLLTVEQLTTVREAAAAGTPVGKVLLDRGLVTAADIGTALEDELGVPRVDLSSYAPDDEALALVPGGVAKARRMLPLFAIDQTLTVAVGDPMDVLSLDDVGAELGLELDPVLSDPVSLLGAIAQYYPEGGAAEPAEVPLAPGPTAVSAPSDTEGASAVRQTQAEHAAQGAPGVAEGASAVREAAAQPPAPREDSDRSDTGGASAEQPFAVPADSHPAAAEPVLSPDDFSFADDVFVLDSPPVAPIAEQDDEVGEPAPPAAAPATAPASAQAAIPESASATLEKMAASEPSAGPTAVDLDVLAVADKTKIAVLVADILSDAAGRGATRIHLLPYKDDFFLVYRIAGRLEKVASAPLSMQGALVDAFKAFARISSTPAGSPALGRVRAHLADRDLVLTVSVVPTIAGQRVVISLTPFRPDPRSLSELGMSEAEERALHAMVERGRGILLVAAPVSGGRSATYYSLLAHAAAAGKTVYSVERSVEYEIPAVAQVLVSPGSPAGASAYLAVGMRQDTDVIAIDGMHTAEDIDLAVEAAGTGHLVICTFAAGDIASAVRRMLDLGAESHGLAGALTLAVGQRLVRLNCPNCTMEGPSDLAARIPGAPAGLVDMAGTGCPNCNKSGFRGVTGLFEVLPFTELVRSAVARAGSADAIAAAAKTAGMRPLIVAGLAKVVSGTVSAEELDRVLRFAE